MSTPCIHIFIIINTGYLRTLCLADSYINLVVLKSEYKGWWCGCSDCVARPALQGCAHREAEQRNVILGQRDIDNQYNRKNNSIWYMFLRFKMDYLFKITSYLFLLMVIQANLKGEGRIIGDGISVQNYWSQRNMLRPENEQVKWVYYIKRAMVRRTKAIVSSYLV